MAVEKTILMKIQSSTIARLGLAIYAFLHALLNGGLSVHADDVNWQATIQDAQRVAAAENKVVLIHFWASHCSPCRDLDAYVFRNSLVAAKINEKVIPVKVNTQDNPEIAKAYSISKIPQDVFIDPSGQVLFRRISPSSSSNYNNMLDAAVKIAAQGTKQSREALEAMSTIGKQRADDQARSPFLGEVAAEAGNARDKFGSQVSNPIAQTTLPKATVRQTQATAPQTFANHDVAAESFPTHTIEQKSFPEPTFTPAAGLPTLPNMFPKDQHHNITIPNPQALPNAAVPGLSNVLMQNGVSNATPGTAKASGTYDPSKMLPPPALPSPSMTRGSPMPRVLPNAPISNALIPANVQESKRPVNQQVSTEAAIAKPQTEAALDGYCPVTLLTEQKWAKGDQRFGCYHRGQLYLFGSQAALDQFLTEPDRLSPLLAGFDPVDFVSNGQMIQGLRRFGVFCEVKPGQPAIVLFRTAQNREEFKAERATYLGKIMQATAAVN